MDGQTVPIIGFTGQNIKKVEFFVLLSGSGGLEILPRELCKDEYSVSKNRSYSKNEKKIESFIWTAQVYHGIFNV